MSKETFSVTVWLTACLHCERKVPEEAFEVAGCVTYPNSAAPYKARHNKQQQLPGLFDGCQVYFHGQFSQPTPSKEELSALVKCGGGVLLSREPRLYNLDDYPYTVPYHAGPNSSLADCAIFVIYDVTCRSPPTVVAERMSCLPVAWLLGSIASFTLKEKTEYFKIK